ncbi:MAG: hypothetical protein U0840_15405 [Gemmataceae bacterium]
MLKRCYLVSLCVLSAGIAFPAVSRADRLDNQLHAQMDEIVAELKRKYSTIGVLHFRVQEGTSKESYASPLSSRMAERVENLVMIHNGSDERQALGLVRDVSAVAARHKIGSWSNSVEARKKLLAQKYPLAWGAKTASPDAFLTGKVSLSKDRKKTLVTLESFDRANPAELHRLGSITVDTDHFILRDLGYSLVVSKRARTQLTRSRNTTQQEEQIYLDELGQGQKSTTDRTQQPQPNEAQPSNIGGIALELVVDGKPVSIRPANFEGQAIRWQCDTPPANSTIALRLRNTTDRRLGVVVQLNGVSTINEQRTDPEQAAKWIIPPKKSYLLKGFYLLEEEVPASPQGGRSSKRTAAKEQIDEGDVGPATPKQKPQDGDQPKDPNQPQPAQKNPTRVKLFKVLVEGPGQQVAQEFGTKKGLIEVDVFEEGESGDDTMLVSPKGLPPSREKQARSSYLGLRSALLKSSKLTTTVVTKREGGLVVKKETIVPDTAAIQADQRIQLTTFPNPKMVSRLTIKIQPTDLEPVSGQ